MNSFSGVGPMLSLVGMGFLFFAFLHSQDILGNTYYVPGGFKVSAGVPGQGLIIAMIATITILIGLVIAWRVGDGIEGVVAPLFLGLLLGWLPAFGLTWVLRKLGVGWDFWAAFGGVYFFALALVLILAIRNRKLDF